MNDLDQRRIGPRLRRVRRERGLTLAEVAADAGITKGFLSLLERNEATPSVPTLLKLCGSLGVRIGSLVEDDAGTSVVRRADRREELFGGFGITDTLLTPRDQPFVEVISSTIAPGGRSGDEPHAFEADAEVIVVLSGMLEVVFADEGHRLRRGDALTLSPRRPHTWTNPSPTRIANVLWIVTPPAL